MSHRYSSISPIRASGTESWTSTNDPDVSTAIGSPGVTFSFTSTGTDDPSARKFAVSKGSVGSDGVNRGTKSKPTGSRGAHKYSLSDVGLDVARREAEAEGLTSEPLIQQVLDTVPVP